MMNELFNLEEGTILQPERAKIAKAFGVLKERNKTLETLVRDKNSDLNNLDCVMSTYVQLMKDVDEIANNKELEGEQVREHIRILIWRFNE